MDTRRTETMRVSIEIEIASDDMQGLASYLLQLTTRLRSLYWNVAISPAHEDIRDAAGAKRGSWRIS